MKKIITIISLMAFACSQQLSAQIQVGSATYSKKPGKISGDEYAAFKKTTTVFILQEKDYNHKEDFEKAIAKVWTVTPFKIIKPNEMRSENIKTTSFFDFGGIVISRQSQTMTTYNTYLSYDLFMVDKNKRGKYDKNLFGKFLLHPDFDTYRLTMQMANRRQSDFSEAVSAFMFSKAVIYNWSPGMLACYLKTINDGLAKEDTRGIFEGEENDEALAKLQTETLYIPDYVNIKFNAFTGGENETEQDDQDVKGAYPYPVKFVSTEALNKLIETSPEGIKFLSYIKSSSDKFVSIFDSKDGKMIYSRYTPISYNFKNKDLKKLASAVK